MRIVSSAGRPAGIGRRAVSAVCAAGIAMIATTSLPSMAHADTSVMGTYQNKQTGRCLDGNADGYLYMSICDSTKKNPYQQWAFIYKDDSNTNTIIQVATGRCLGVDWGLLKSVSCGSRTPKDWIKQGDIRRLADRPEWCLDGNQSMPYVRECNGGNYQNWQLNVIKR